MSKADRALPKVLILVIVALSLGVLWHGLKVWNSYNLRKVKELESREALLEQEYKEALRKLEKYEIMFSNFQGGINTETFGSQPQIDGVVEAVNPADRLVVISVGKDQGVKLGFRFSVRRGGEHIARVQVIEVYDDLSGARIVYMKDADEIQVGDTIVSSTD